jgi:Na+-driven multidrug efflux pump
MPAMAMSYTNSAFIGKFIGKGDVNLAKRYAKISQILVILNVVF